MNKFWNSNRHVSSLYKFRLPKFIMPAAPLDSNRAISQYLTNIYSWLALKSLMSSFLFFSCDIVLYVHWLDECLMSHITHYRYYQRWSFRSITWQVLAKLNYNQIQLTTQKTKLPLKHYRHTNKLNLMQLKLGVGDSCSIRSGNGVGLFYSSLVHMGLVLRVWWHNK